MAQTSLVGKWFIIWHKTKQKNTGVYGQYGKISDQERTNQNAWRQPCNTIKDLFTK